jgi:hypothetical protein
MPPKRTESSQKATEQEGRVLLALQAYQKGQFNSIRAAAKQFSVSYVTLSRRAKSLPSRVDTRANGYKLTQLEEDALT